MTHDDTFRPRLTREDSRALDGLMPADGPPRAGDGPGSARERTRDLVREALDLWSAESRTVGQAVDPERLAERVLARVASAPEGSHLPPAPVSWGYAAAAAALIALGLGGLRLARPAGGLPAAPAVASQLEAEGLAVLRRLELERLAVVEGR